MSTSTKVRAFGPEFCGLVCAVLAAKCKDGECVKRSTVARLIRKSVAIKNLDLLTVMVGLAVQEGSCAGYASVRGRNGGIYDVAQLAAWNASVDAADAKVIAEPVAKAA